MKSIMKSLMGGLVALAIAGCTGPVGPQGEPGQSGAKGEKGDQGEGFEGGPSISAVFPTGAFLGESATVQISGFATEWTSAATVEFGQGVTVKSVTVASPTALIAEIEVAPNATPGIRTVTVTEGSAVAKFENVFAVKPVVDVEVLGTVTQGSVSVLRLRSNLASVALPTDEEVTSNLDGSNGMLIIPFAATDAYVDLLLLTDMTAAASAQEVVITMFPNTSNERVVPLSVTVGAANVANVQVGAQTVSMAAPFQSTAFKIAATEVSAFDIRVSASGKTPKVFMFDATGAIDGLLTYSAGLSSGLDANDFVYAIVWDETGASGYDAQLDVGLVTIGATTTEMEQNGDLATAQALDAVPMNVQASFSALDDVDYFKVTVTAAEVGKRLHVRTWPGHATADAVVEIVAANGTSLGVSNDVNYHEDLVSAPIAAAGEYYIFVTQSSYVEVHDPAASEYKLMAWFE